MAILCVLVAAVAVRWARRWWPPASVAAPSACDPLASPPPPPPISAPVAPPAIPLLEAARKAVSFPVKLEGPDAAHQWTIEAVHGVVDEAVVLTGGQTSKPPPAAGAVADSTAPSKATVALYVTPAQLGADATVPLHLETVDGSVVPESVALAPGDQTVLRLRGSGFSRVDTYRATLTVAGTIYALRIRSTSPYRPLGLRAAELQATRSDVPVFGERRVSFSAVIPADSATIAGGAYHVAVKPPEHGAVGAQRLPVCGVRVEPAGEHAVTLSFPPLEAGQYQGIVEIQGEPLVVDLTLKNGWAIVVVLVAFGGALSFAGRGWLNYRLAKERNENAIRAAENKYEKMKSAIGWDDLQVRNAFRRARGSNAVLGLEDVDALLADITPRTRPELKLIQDALDKVSLPEPFKNQVRQRLTRLLRLSSRSDEDAIARGLAMLADEAQRQFAPPLVTWLDDLKNRVTEVDGRTQHGLEPPNVSALEARRAKACFLLLHELVADARKLLVGDDSAGTLDPRHAEFLARIDPALAAVEKMTDKNISRDPLVDFLHCKLPPADAATPASPSSKPFPAELGIRATPAAFGTELRAHEEIDFQLVEVAPDRQTRDIDPEDHELTWRANGNVEVAKGGMRMTYVFQSWSLGRTRRQRVEAFANGKQLAIWQEPIRDAWSLALRERRATVVARFGVTLLGIAIASAAAVALYWTNKPFGSITDYMTPFSIGFGADLTVVGAGTKLLDSLLGALRRRGLGEER
jgi:hypothetical protein